jgi:hypothetical protein
MHKSILFTLSLTIAQVLSGKVYQGLKVIGDYKDLPIAIHFAPYETKPSELEKDLHRAVKLKMLSSGFRFKYSTEGNKKHYLEIRVSYMKENRAFASSIALVKLSESYTSKENRVFIGDAFHPEQGGYDIHGISVDGKGDDMVREISKSLERFLIDYLESNLK